MSMTVPKSEVHASARVMSDEQLLAALTSSWRRVTAYPHDKSAYYSWQTHAIEASRRDRRDLEQRAQQIIREEYDAKALHDLHAEVARWKLAPIDLDAVIVAGRTLGFKGWCDHVWFRAVLEDQHGKVLRVKLTKVDGYCSCPSKGECGHVVACRAVWQEVQRGK